MGKDLGPPSCTLCVGDVVAVWNGSGPGTIEVREKYEKKNENGECEDREIYREKCSGESEVRKIYLWV